MKVEFTSAVIKDAKSITDAKLKKKLAEVIEELENAETLQEVNNVKKLKGFTNAFRIRIGNYRLGFEKFDDLIILGRILKRNDIYKLFP